MYIGNTSTLHAAGNQTYSSRIKHVALRVFFIQELVQKERINVHYVKVNDQFLDIGTNHLIEHMRRYLIKVTDAFKA